MVFQIMDDKKDCIGVYANENFIYDRIPENAEYTWGYSDHLRDRHIQYASLWTQGADLGEICPEHLVTRWTAAENKIKSHFKSLYITKINLSDICFFDLVPNKQLQHYFQTKNDICEWVFENIEKPRHYNLLHDLSLIHI